VNGYCRSEGVVAVFLQKKEVANRIYTTVLHSLTNADGYKEQGSLLVHIIFKNKSSVILHIGLPSVFLPSVL